MAPRVLSIGEWEVRPAEGVIIGRGGRRHIRPKSMDVLLRLAQTPRDVVPRQTIIAEVWRHGLASDESLTACIAELRRTLGDSRTEPAYIQTIPKRGYRLVADVVTEPAADADSGRAATPHSTQRLQTAKPSLAVLPFKNLSNDPSQEYFSDGISEDIITRLARFHELVVIARNSSFAFRDEDVDVRNVGQRLSVDYVVLGSIRKAAGLVRVTAQLVDAATRRHIWAQNYDRESAEIFDVQDEISSSIASTLVGNIEKYEAISTANAPTESLGAYDCYLRGSYLLKNLVLDDLRAALAYFERAIEEDPGFAAARSRLAGIRMILHYFLEIQDDELVIRELIEDAMRLDSDDSYGRLVLALLTMSQGQYDLAKQHLEIVLASHPNDSELIAWGALGHLLLGHLDEARRLLTQATRLNPLRHDFQNSIEGRLAYLEHDYAGSIEAFRRSPSYRQRIWDVATVAASLAQLDRHVEAEEERQATVNLLVERSASSNQVMDFASLAERRMSRFQRESDRRHLLAGYAKAQLM